MKFAILHHSACDGRLFHYRIDATGATTQERDETQAGEHKRSIGIVLEGDFAAAPPTPQQMAALQALLLAVKKRFPDIEIGGHRQVRGVDTECPGNRFPLADLRAWSKSALLVERDAAMRNEIDRQYYRP